MSNNNPKKKFHFSRAEIEKWQSHFQAYHKLFEIQFFLLSDQAYPDAF